MELKKRFSKEERLKESEKMLSKFKDRVPVVCEKIKNNSIKELEKNKYLVPKDLSISQFMFILRKRIELTEKDAIFIYINGVLPKNTLTFEEIYSEYKNDDNFLYIEYGLENTFG
jgi:GABA(A) receptor-associated protein